MTHRRVFFLELPIREEWEGIEPLRASVLACVQAVFRDAGRSEALSMVASELIENAVKFGDWSRRVDAPFSLRVAGDGEGVEVVVTNPVPPGSAGVARLLAEVRRIAAAPSPEQAYTKAVRGVALGKATSLGLARAAYEGGCDLSARLDGDVLRVRAVTRRLAPTPPTPAAPA